MGVVHLGCDCQWLLDLWLAAKSDGAIYRRSCDDCGIILHRQRVVDVAGLHCADGDCLLAGKTGLLKIGGSSSAKPKPFCVQGVAALRPPKLKNQKSVSRLPVFEFVAALYERRCFLRRSQIAATITVPSAAHSCRHKPHFCRVIVRCAGVDCISLRGRSGSNFRS